MFRASKTLMAAVSAAAKTTTKPAVKPVAAAAKPKKPRAKPATSGGEPRGILKVAPVSPAMAKFLGVPETSRTDAVKKIWEYIKLHNLQTPTDKRVILCDDKLKTIFEGQEKVGFLEIGKLLSRHFVKTEV